MNLVVLSRRSEDDRKAKRNEGIIIYNMLFSFNIFYFHPREIEFDEQSASLYTPKCYLII